MRLWLLDADVIIKLLELDVFDRLVSQHKIHVASTVIHEVKYYRQNGEKTPVTFRQTYVTQGRVSEVTATVEELKEVMRKLPPLQQQALDAGEIESLATLVKDGELTFCTFDAAAIRALPFLDATTRAISAERLFRLSGLTLSPNHKLDVRLSEEYFRSNLAQGQMEFVKTIR
ncbi:MAG: hypothetical protein AB9866_15690 [Syntrophobacteraceae bacterium]